MDLTTIYVLDGAVGVESPLDSIDSKSERKSTINKQTKEEKRVMDVLNSFKGYFENSLVNAVNNVVQSIEKEQAQSMAEKSTKKNPFDGVVCVDDEKVTPGKNRLIITGYLGPLYNQPKSLNREAMQQKAPATNGSSASSSSAKGDEASSLKQDKTPAKLCPTIPSKNSLVKVEPRALHEFIKHSENYLVWNLSGYTYDYEPLKSKVIEYQFPGHPAPPMNILLEIAHSIQSWLDEKPENIAIIHDVSGRRSAVVVACCIELSYFKIGLTERFGKGLKHVLSKLGTVSDAIVPSQLRYHAYFCEYLAKQIKSKEEEKESDKLKKEEKISHSSSAEDDAVVRLDKWMKPRTLQIVRIIVNKIPDFVNDKSPQEIAAQYGVENISKHMKPVICKPSLKIFQLGALLGSTNPGPTFDRNDESFILTPANENGEPLMVCGDVLVRAFHYRDSDPQKIPATSEKNNTNSKSGEEGKESSNQVGMFSIAFHTSFISEDNILRLDLQEIDGTKDNARFPQGFFVDIVFSSTPIPIQDVKSTKAMKFSTPSKMEQQSNNINAGNTISSPTPPASANSFASSDIDNEIADELGITASTTKLANKGSSSVNESDNESISATLEEIDAILNQP